MGIRWWIIQVAVFIIAEILDWNFWHTPVTGWGAAVLPIGCVLLGTIIDVAIGAWKERKKDA